MTDTAGCKFVKIRDTPGWRNSSVSYSRQYELPDFSRPANWLFAGAGLAAIVLTVGVSSLAGLFLLVPLVFVAILLQTAFTHYFGSADADPLGSA
jgi:hypothetical protein